jgi:hypothetical protein
MELSKVLEARLKTLQEAYGKQQECEIYLKEFGKKEELPIEEVKNGTEPISE